MPFILAVIGIVLIVSGIRGTTNDLAANLYDDFTSKSNGTSFMVWVAAIVVIGLLGYIPYLRKISRLLLLLVVVVLLLKNNGGFFNSFVQQIENPPQPAKVQPIGGNASLPNIPVTLSIQGAKNALSDSIDSSVQGAKDAISNGIGKIFGN